MVVDNDFSFGPTLLVGFGPASIQVAVDLARRGCERLGFLNRPGAKTRRLRVALERQRYLSLLGQGQCEAVAGQASIDDFYEDPLQLRDEWQILVLCVPAHAYREVLESLPWDSLARLQHILLLSPALGSALLASQLVRGRREVEIVSLSNYYAATKYAAAEDPLTAVTKAVKRRIYIASTQRESAFLAGIRDMLANHGIDAVGTQRCLDAESRNITNYVHPPFFLSDFALQAVLGGAAEIPKYMYKLYPAGPITPARIRSMLVLWKEQSRLLERLGIAPLNLLKFLNDDNYPVPETLLGRDDIEGFCDLDEVRQSYLLYVRYTALLVDPFSRPDRHGYYFDFSAVPFVRAAKNADGLWTIPRIPLEDYRKLKLTVEMGRRVGVAMPEAAHLLATFERAREGFLAERGAAACHSDLGHDEEGEDASIIIQAWRLEA
ncbi:hypothetical protein RF55_18479 [Lasius niger]|uniref:DUF2338 family protein n=1 Tax=Lasius niger TaxID=67767 RepID=A0A0J7K1C0_LASNI|nr:hypothetical protein RF55_18479 [Lasius niger]